MKAISQFLLLFFILAGATLQAENKRHLGGKISFHKSFPVSPQKATTLKSRETPNVNKFMRKVMRQYNRNKPEQSHITRAYFRETGVFNEKYVFFSESNGYSIFMKKPRNAALFSNYKFFPEQSRISDIAPGFLKKFQAINLQEGRKESDFRDVGFSNNENNYRRFQEYGPLSRKNHRKFQYHLDSAYKNKGVKYYKITFTKSGFQGSMIVNSSNLNLVKTQYKTNQLVSSPYKNNVEGRVELSFSYDKDTPYLAEMESRSTVQGLTITHYLKILSEHFSGFDVTEEEY